MDPPASFDRRAAQAGALSTSMAGANPSMPGARTGVVRSVLYLASMGRRAWSEPIASHAGPRK